MKKIFNEDHKEFIKKNATNMRNDKLTDLINKEFGTSFTVAQVKKFKYAHKISSGLKSCNLPVGSERKSKGYILVKTAEPNVWNLKHHIVYESKYGKIPTGYKILFLDGNKTNCNIDNLRLIKNSEEAFINKMGWTNINREFTEVAVNLAKLKEKIKNKEENKNEKI